MKKKKKTIDGSNFTIFYIVDQGAPWRLKIRDWYE